MCIHDIIIRYVLHVYNYTVSMQAIVYSAQFASHQPTLHKMHMAAVCNL